MWPVVNRLGSLSIAVPLLLTIAAVLAWGTVYETRFGTAAVQRFIYQSWWFQLVLGFLAVNLATAALVRWPWQRRQLPFLLAHLGIILILLGGILGGRFGVEGQLIIPEGDANHLLDLPVKALVVHQPNPGGHHIIPTRFDTEAWRTTPNATYTVPLEGRTLTLTVDRYYPDATLTETIGGGAAESPAVRVVLDYGGQHGEGWLLARDAERFGAQWGPVHVLFLEVPDAAHLAMLARPPAARRADPMAGRLPPNTIVLVNTPAGGLAAVLTGPGRQRQHVKTLELGRAYLHPWSGTTFRVAAYEPRGQVVQEAVPRGATVRAEALRVVGRDGDRTAAAWVGLGGMAALAVGDHPVLVEYRKMQIPLPFTVALKDFRRTDYPGTQMAAGFEADVTLSDPARGVSLTRTIRMNNPLKYRGYSLFQASYIEGPVETTVLAVRKDPGVPFVYAGFVIVVLGVVLLFRRRPIAAPLDPSGVAGTGYKLVPGTGKVMTWVTAAWLVGCGVAAAAEPSTPTPRPAAVLPTTLAALRCLPIQHQGRVKPFDSFARETLSLVTGRPRWERQAPSVTVLSIIAQPDVWQEVRLLSVPFGPLREALGLPKSQTHASYNELVATRALMRRLPPIMEKQSRDEPLTMLEHETMDAYQRFVAFSALIQQDLALVPPLSGTGYKPVPGTGNVWRPIQTVGLPAWQALLAAWRESPPAAAEAAIRAFAAAQSALAPPGAVVPWRLALEVGYHQAAPFTLARLLYALSAVALALGLAGRAPPKDAGRAVAIRLGLATAALGWLVHAAGLLVRVAIGGRPPVSNFYETMLWLPFVAVTIALLLERRRQVAYAGLAAAILAAITLLLADHVPLDPSVAPVVAVLRSRLWLTIHVLTIVASYGALALATVLAHFYGSCWLARRTHPALESLGTALYRAIQIGVVLLAAGVMLGAVWANASWGRYWGWDPKETWALITLLWFLALLHGRVAGWIRGVGLAAGTIAGFFLLLMTYYGVSFYLVGLHSYAGGHAKPLPPLLVGFVLAELALLAALGGTALRRRPRRCSSL